MSVERPKATVHLRGVTVENFAECVSLEVGDSQRNLVASNLKSLAEAKVNPKLYPLAIYDGAVAGWEEPKSPMIGFTMYEVADGVGFINRLMIGQAHQGKGYGRAAMLEVIRRLKLYPEVELIATSHVKGNEAASALYGSLGFVAWDIGWAEEDPSEVYLKLPERL